MSNSPKIKVYKDSLQGIEFVNQQSYQFGNVVQDTTRTIKLLLINDAADSVLSILENAIAVSGDAVLQTIQAANLVDGVLTPSSTISLPVNLQYRNGIFVTLQLNTAVLGSKSAILQIASNDPSSSSYYYTINFSNVAASTTNPDISLIVSNNLLENDAVYSLGSISQNSSKVFEFQIANFGIPSLNISVGGVQIVKLGSDETFNINPTAASSISLGFNQTSTFSVNLDSSTIGENSFVISIISNAVDKSPFSFTVVYEVREGYKLVVRQSNLDVVDGETISLGSVKKSSELNKAISLSNSGITYIIKVTNIYASGSSYLSEVPALPFILEPNSTNRINFNIKMETSTLGTKNSSMYIQWEVVL